MSEVIVEPLTGPYSLGEGPHWDCISQNLYFVDIFAQKVFRFDPATGSITSAFIENGPVGFVIPIEGSTNKFVAGSGLDFVLFSWNENKDLVKCTPQVLSTVERTMGFEKDGVFPSNVGSLYSIGNDLIFKKRVTPVSISNGLAWNSNNDTLYYIDSLTYQIMAYNYDSQTGTISNKKTVFDLQKNNIPGLPDGMTIDTDENLWVAVFGGGGVLNINPKTGKLLRFVKINNVKNITSVTFGGPNLDILYVTSANIGLNENELKDQPHAGYLFAIKVLPESREK
ncbi:Regucalcin [Eufriesea mexicana]|uniref:Regucalcin n=1 Tax=Eufriesea mexicana TaxID=516756 RepID=A0A310SDJ6_9HYME|nr:Regucalcin [Eufriesea mexicana]